MQRVWQKIIGDKMTELKIKITTSVYTEDAPLEFSIEEAKQIYEELKKVFNDGAITNRSLPEWMTGKTPIGSGAGGGAMQGRPSWDNLIVKKSEIK